MPPHELPDEHRDWPADPFALLGVERGADDLAVRTAYTRLIRRFKPEHHPEQFAKIRAAYEACRAQGQWFRVEPAAPSAEPFIVRAEPHSDAALPPLRRAVPVPDAVEVLWAEAIAGNGAEAYRGLVAEALRGGSTEPALRLYWLLAFDPALDADRTRHEWLLDALTRSRLRGSPLELYRRELEADPAAALGDPYTELFDIPADAAQLYALAHLRLAAAGRTDRFALLEADLKRLRKRLGIDRGAEWLALVVSAVDWATWSAPNPTLTFCESELESLHHLELQHSDLFDRVDHVRFWSGKALAVPGPSLAKFIRLIGMLWAIRGRVSRAELAEGLTAIAEQPYFYLGTFDNRSDFFAGGFGPLALDLLGRYLPHLADAHSADLLRGYVRRVIPNLDSGWGELRLPLLEWMTFDRIGPEELAEACAADPDWRIRAIAERLRSDLSLRLVWVALSLCPAATASR